MQPDPRITANATKDIECQIGELSLPSAFSVCRKEKCSGSKGHLQTAPYWDTAVTAKTARTDSIAAAPDNHRERGAVVDYSFTSHQSIPPFGPISTRLTRMRNLPERNQRAGLPDITREDARSSITFSILVEWRWAYRPCTPTADRSVVRAGPHWSAGGDNEGGQPHS